MESVPSSVQQVFTEHRRCARPAVGSGVTVLSRRDNSPCSNGALILALTSPSTWRGTTAQAGAHYLARYMVVRHRYSLFTVPGQERA